MVSPEQDIHYNQIICCMTVIVVEQSIMEVTDSVQMDVTDSVQSDSKSRWGENSNNNRSGFTLFSSKLQAAPVKQAENTGFGTFLGGGFKLGGSQKTTCECGLGISCKTGAAKTLSQVEKNNLKWKIGNGFVERLHPYTSEEFKWRVGDKEPQKGEMFDLKIKETRFGCTEDQYQINLEDEATVYYKLKKIHFTPVHKGCFESEAEREKSFYAPQCPTSLSSRACEFARAGFFYTGLEDAVKCFACGVGVHQWEEGDDIRSDHIRWSVNQNCPHMRKTFPEMF